MVEIYLKTLHLANHLMDWQTAVVVDNRTRTPNGLRDPVCGLLQSPTHEYPGSLWKYGENILSHDEKGTFLQIWQCLVAPVSSKLVQKLAG